MPRVDILWQSAMTVFRLPYTDVGMPVADRSRGPTPMARSVPCCLLLAAVAAAAVLPTTIVAQEQDQDVVAAEEADQAHAAVKNEPETPLDDAGRLVRFERDIAPILREHCLECHGPEDAKNDFRVDDPELLMLYVEPEEAEFSLLYSDYLTTSDETLLMPPPSHGGPLSPEQLALVRVWINEGAGWPEDFKLVAVDEDENTAAMAEADESSGTPDSLAARLWSFQAYLHPATVHFPIALLLIGALFVVLGVKWPVLGTQIPMACLLLGAASAIAATMMGWSFATQQGYGGWTKYDLDSEIFWHRWSAVVVTVASTLLAVIALYSANRQRPGLQRFWKSGLVLVALLVGLVGHQGGVLTYGEDFYPKAFRILLGQNEPTSDTPKTVPDHPAGDSP